MRHESQGYGFEEIHKGERIFRVKGGVLPKGTTMPGIVPGGQIATSVAYRMLAEMAQAAQRTNKPPGWYVERRIRDGQWITAGRDLQFRRQGLQAARAFVENLPQQYRLVIRTPSGEYKPLRRVR